MRLGDDPATYYVVGTAFAMPDEPESTKVRSSDLFSTPHAACLLLLSFMRGSLCGGPTSPAHQGQLLQLLLPWPAAWPLHIHVL